jgi:hypothetical protein
VYKLNILLRYPDDPYDRVWIPQTDPEAWAEISTPEKVKDMLGIPFDAPSVVMQTAITPRNRSMSRAIEFSFAALPNHVYPVPGCVGMLYFAELQVLDVGAARQFNMFVNSDRWSNAPYMPLRLATNTYFNSVPYVGVKGQYNFILNATANSTMPPIINAAEFFSVVSTANVATDAQDGN